jgi:predicted SAM-dependent methyltransferase
MKLHLGCGPKILDGWINVDYSLGARLAKVPLFRAFNRRANLFNMDWDRRIFLHDLTRPFPWKDGSADMVYTSHTVEHFSREQGRRFLRECHRVLKEDGILRVIVPDLAFYVREYSAGNLRADDFVEKLGVLHHGTGSRLKDSIAPLIQFPHKCMYDAPTMVAVLEEAGFAAESRGAYESAIPDIRALEAPSRVQNAVIVEGRKRSRAAAGQALAAVAEGARA